MSILNPEYFWLLLLLVPIFITKNYKSVSLVIYGYILSFIFIVVALSRPVMEQEPVKQERVLSDVIVAVDLSHSMRATDIKPTRLEGAKKILKKLVKSDSNTRYAVLGFTTNAVVLSPLTQDSELLLHLYDTLDENLIITKGSSIMSALELSAKMSKSKNPSMVILSDGADEFSYEAQTKFAKQRGLVVNVMMLATSMGGTLNAKNGELVKDELGDIVVSRENDAIQTIANATGGVYTKEYDSLRSALESQKNHDYKTKTMLIQNKEYFYYFIVLALITFLVTLTSLKRYVVAFFLLFGIALHANTNNELSSQAISYYKTGEYEKALVHFEMLKSSDESYKSLVYYNIANSYVRLKKFKKAKEAYLKSLTLKYSYEADENMRYIQNAQEQMQMNTGQEKTDKKSSFASEQKNSKKSKEGGSSNMKVQAPASSGNAEMGEKTKSEGMLNLNKTKAKLSSKQYDLINKRGIHEKKPW